MFLNEGGHFYVNMHFYATFLPIKVKNDHFHVTMHFYAIFFTYMDLSEEGRCVHFYVIFYFTWHFLKCCCT